MNSESDDRDLCERFALLRSEDGLHAPVFREMVVRARGQQRVGWRSWAALTTAALALLVALTIVLLPAPRHPPAPVLSIINWRAPTDFLLETPGRQLLGAPPRIGVGLLAASPMPNDPSERRTPS